MKNYTITVNGRAYDVTVEERKGGAPFVPTVTTTAAPAAPVPAAAAAPAAVGGAGNIKVEAGAAGKVFKIEAPAGTQLKAGDPIIILEVMKMETPVVAPKDGVVASINVSEGQMVEAESYWQ